MLHFEFYVGKIFALIFAANKYLRPEISVILNNDDF